MRIYNLQKPYFREKALYLSKTRALISTFIVLECGTVSFYEPPMVTQQTNIWQKSNEEKNRNHTLQKLLNFIFKPNTVNVIKIRDNNLIRAVI